MKEKPLPLYCVQNKEYNNSHTSARTNRTYAGGLLLPDAGMKKGREPQLPSLSDSGVDYSPMVQYMKYLYPRGLAKKPLTSFSSM